MRRRSTVGVVTLVLFFTTARSALGWIYSEHREITARGIETLDPQHQAALSELWSAAREGQAARLCEMPAAGDQGMKPSCIDLAAWGAIAGDHSCSPKQMLETILESGWILQVAHISARTRVGLAKAKSENERRNAQMNGDLALERTDKEYSSRASAGNAHFLLPRSGGDPKQYAIEVLRPGAEPNAMALYVLFHLAAMQRAALLGEEHDAPAERAAGARLALALETFALHFLEDSFAAGHIAGSWGPAAERKGTHDYYNEHGLDTDTWSHESLLLFGDGHMTSEDLDRAGKAVRMSLTEVVEALKAGSPVERDALHVNVPGDILSGAYDICKASAMPGWPIPSAMHPYLGQVLLETPIPFRGPGFASLPRFRAELGPFIGIASGISGANADGGFASGEGGGVLGALDVGLRLGVGLDALLGDGGDGLLYVQGGILMESRSTGGCDPNCPSDPLLQQFVPGVPARTGLSLRLRMPYWLIPGDLILAAPVLAFTNPKLLEKMGISAADGGLIPWQTKLSTPAGRLQFVVGREVAVHLFGYLGQKDAFLAINPDGPDGKPVLTPIALRSIEWNFPVLEIRPFREYGTRYAFAAFLQIGYGLDTPVQAETLVPGQVLPKLKTRHFGYLRILFDGRRYF